MHNLRKLLNPVTKQNDRTETTMSARTLTFPANFDLVSFRHSTTWQNLAIILFEIPRQFLSRMIKNGKALSVLLASFWNFWHGSVHYCKDAYILCICLFVYEQNWSSRASTELVISEIPIKVIYTRNNSLPRKADLGIFAKHRESWLILIYFAQTLLLLLSLLVLFNLLKNTEHAYNNNELSKGWKRVRYTQ